MNINTVTQDYEDKHETGRIVIDDIVDIVVVKRNNEYTVKVIKNNCFTINIEEVEFDEVEPTQEQTADYTYSWDSETKLLTVYENGCVLSTVQGVQDKDNAKEIFYEDVYNIAGVELSEE